MPKALADQHLDPADERGCAIIPRSAPLRAECRDVTRRERSLVLWHDPTQATTKTSSSRPLGPPVSVHASSVSVQFFTFNAISRIEIVCHSPNMFHHHLKQWKLTTGDGYRLATTFVS